MYVHVCIMMEIHVFKFATKIMKENACTYTHKCTCRLSGWRQVGM